MPELLLEIGSEELPAAACREAEQQLPALCRDHLGADPSALFVTPRRLALLIDDLPERTPDEWIKGPPEALREKAAAGFARRYGVRPEELSVRDGFLGVDVPGKSMRDVLPERLRAVVEGLAFAKTMRWNGGGVRFPRPVRWLCALLDRESVELEAAGVRASNATYGHRFTHGRVELATARAYGLALRETHVEPDAAERRRLILEGLDRLGAWSDPLGKLEEVVYLVEWPLVLEGRFDDRFLRLPERVVVTAMQSHQRYFPLGGNRFALVSNGGDPDVVRAGNETVLEGRLDDAAFTFDRDVATGIDALAQRLSAITFFEGAGTYADKTERVTALVEELGGSSEAVQAARLAKADQASELVREFTELEGYIGGQYARLAGYPEEVGAAIEEHYLPDAAGGPLPRTEAGRVLAVADRIDTLNVSFGLGHRPSGSRDPYGLRRAAIGVWRLATEGGVTIPRRLLEGEARDFVEERLEGLLAVPVEFARAARSARADDLGSVARVAEELAAAAGSPEFAAAYEVYDRASRLAGRAAEQAAPQLDTGLLVEDAERMLAEKLAATSLDGAGDVRAKLAAAAELAPLVERFFDEVLVMDEDERLRANRLRLLLDVRETVGALGDFSQIPR